MGFDSSLIFDFWTNTDPYIWRSSVSEVYQDAEDPGGR